jgi:hypothetical protein
MTKKSPEKRGVKPKGKVADLPARSLKAGQTSSVKGGFDPNATAAPMGGTGATGATGVISPTRPTVGFGGTPSPIKRITP